MQPDRPQSKGSFWRSRSGLVLVGFLAIAAFYLLTEHTAHLFGVLPYVLILACPLMHLLHGGHGGHGGDDHAGHEPVGRDTPGDSR